LQLQSITSDLVWMFSALKHQIGAFSGITSMVSVVESNLEARQKLERLRL